jgi:hypothetical protein
MDSEVGVDAGESVRSVGSGEGARYDRSRFTGKSLASPPGDSEGGVGVLALSPESVVGGTGVRPSTGARRSPSESPSSSEEMPSSRGSGAPAIERTVPMLSVYVQI